MRLFMLPTLLVLFFLPFAAGCGDDSMVADTGLPDSAAPDSTTGDAEMDGGGGDATPDGSSDSATDGGGDASADASGDGAMDGGGDAAADGSVGDAAADGSAGDAAADGSAGDATTGTCGMMTCSASQYCDYAMPFACAGAGTCRDRPFICTTEYDPVCGCNGMTYSNGCNAHAAGQDYAAMGMCP